MPAAPRAAQLMAAPRHVPLVHIQRASSNFEPFKSLLTGRPSISVGGSEVGAPQTGRGGLRATGEKKGVGGAADRHVPLCVCGPSRPPVCVRRLALGRLSLHDRATFLLYFRTTAPQLSRKFRVSSSHRPRRGSKGQVLSASFWRDLQFLRYFRQNPGF